MDQIDRNMRGLEAERRTHLRRWCDEWPYFVGDLLVVEAFVIVVVSILT